MKRLLAAVVVLLAFTGCTAKVSTTIEVTGESSATITVAAVFTDEAGEVLAEDPKARGELVELFQNRTQQRPEVTVNNDTVSVSAAITYDQLAASSGLTGVKAMSLSDNGETLTVTYEPATELVEAIVDLNKSLDDAEAVTAVMLQNTLLTVNVIYPGGVKNSAPISGVRVTGDTATFTRTAADNSAGDWVVHGRQGSVRWPWMVGIGVFAAGAVAWWRRRRRR